MTPLQSSHSCSSRPSFEILEDTFSDNPLQRVHVASCPMVLASSTLHCRAMYLHLEKVYNFYCFSVCLRSLWVSRVDSQISQWSTGASDRPNPISGRRPIAIGWHALQFPPITNNNSAYKKQKLVGMLLELPRWPSHIVFQVIFQCVKVLLIILKSCLETFVFL